MFEFCILRNSIARLSGMVAVARWRHLRQSGYDLRHSRGRHVRPQPLPRQWRKLQRFEAACRQNGVLQKLQCRNCPHYTVSPQIVDAPANGPNHNGTPNLSRIDHPASPVWYEKKNGDLHCFFLFISVDSGFSVLILTFCMYSVIFINNDLIGQMLKMTKYE